eukprot:CAMPEP_0113947468 /NCGR_PEP_ID=MMETSP1339-20121228/65042_1 /TAXON_ID=94617 /ORGANISM="Fibrocapsa japonica" /LENGTH=76 /DNA_ID=CAMNT_0000954101 /DNA_START=76 /DNA_END=303 /DNA_ORIENTATION=+ /assembly_acc=CAM_ASM_000762
MTITTNLKKNLRVSFMKFSGTHYPLSWLPKHYSGIVQGALSQNPGELFTGAQVGVGRPGLQAGQLLWVTWVPPFVK